MASFSVAYAKIYASNRRIGSVPGISTQQWQQQQSNNISFPSSASQKQSSIWRLHATNNEIVPFSSSEPYSMISDIMGKASGLFKLVDTKDLTVVNMNFNCDVEIGKQDAVLVRSPIRGTFYRSPKKDDPNQNMKVGDKVVQGTVVCRVDPMLEAETKEKEITTSGTITEILVEDGTPVSVYTVGDKMEKGQNEVGDIVAPVSGTIFDILVEDAQPVNVGRPLFVISPIVKKASF